MSPHDPASLRRVGSSRLVVSRLRLRDALRDHRGWTRLPALLDELDGVRRLLQRAPGALPGTATESRQPAHHHQGDAR
jgi:hypothetical protein